MVWEAHLDSFFTCPENTQVFLSLYLFIPNNFSLYLLRTRLSLLHKHYSSTLLNSLLILFLFYSTMRFPTLSIGPMMYCVVLPPPLSGTGSPLGSSGILF